MIIYLWQLLLFKSLFFSEDKSIFCQSDLSKKPKKCISLNEIDRQCSQVIKSAIIDGKHDRRRRSLKPICAILLCLGKRHYVTNCENMLCILVSSKIKGLKLTCLKSIFKD